MIINTKRTVENSPLCSIILEPGTDVHMNTFILFSFIERGSATVEFYSKTEKKTKIVELKENDCFLIFPFMSMCYKSWSKDNFCNRNVYIDDIRFKHCCDAIDPNLYKSIEEQSYPPIMTLTPTSLMHFSERSSLILRKETPITSKLHKCLVFDILSEYISSRQSKTIYPLWIRSLLRNLDDLEFSLLSIEEMIKTTHYSHGYVNREFKKYLKMSLKQYVLRKKITMSATLLATTDKSVQEIVDELHFCDVSNYINTFKIFYNITPAKYRKMHRSNIDIDSYQQWGSLVQKE